MTKVINGKPRMYVTELQKDDLSGSLDTVVTHLRRIEDTAGTPLLFEVIPNDTFEWYLNVYVYRDLTADEQAAWNAVEQQKAEHLEYLKGLCGQEAANFQI